MVLWQVILIVYCIVSVFVSIFIAITDLVGDGSEPITRGSFLFYRLANSDRLTLFGKIFLGILFFYSISANFYRWSHRYLVYKRIKIKPLKLYLRVFYYIIEFNVALGE